MISYVITFHVNPVQRRLLGESLREIGVLVFVFFPLNILLESKTNVTAYPHIFWFGWLSVQHWITIFFGVAGIALLYFGIKIEAKAISESGEDR